MMPTFPASPLSFCTAGFLQYGWKKKRLPVICSLPLMSHGLNVIPISATVQQRLLHPLPCYSDYSTLDPRYACFTPITQGALHRFCLDLATLEPLPHQHSMWHSGQLSSFLRATSPQGPSLSRRLYCPPSPIAPTASSASLGNSRRFHLRGLYARPLSFVDHPDSHQDPNSSSRGRSAGQLPLWT